MRKQILTTAVTVLLVLGMSATVTAATDDAQRKSDVNVSVASKVAIDVHPKEMDFTKVDVGSQRLTADRGFGSVNLENVGSEYVSQIWVNATRTGADVAELPYGSGSASNYNAGNFLQVRPANDSGLLLGTQNEYNYVNRIEYFTYDDQRKPSYIDAPDTGTYYDNSGTESTASDVAVGRFRINDNEYWAAIPVGSGSQCTGSNGDFNTLLVAKKPHNSSATTPVDFEAGDEGYPGIPGEDYYVFNLTGSSVGNTVTYGKIDPASNNQDNGEPGLTLESKVDHDGDSTEEVVNRTYTALTHCDDSVSGVSYPHVIRTKYNVEAGDTTDLSSDQAVTFLMDATNENNMLPPGEMVSIDTAIEVPRGVPQGIVNAGELRVVVTADEGANTS